MGQATSAPGEGPGAAERRLVEYETLCRRRLAEYEMQLGVPANATASANGSAPGFTPSTAPGLTEPVPPLPALASPAVSQPVGSTTSTIMASTIMVKATPETCIVGDKVGVLRSSRKWTRGTA